MRKTLITRALLVALALLVLMPALTLALAWYETFGRSVALLGGYATEIARRSVDARNEEQDLVARLKALPPQPPCSPAQMEQMRIASATQSYIQGVGVIDGTTIRCTTLVNLAHPLELGAPLRVSPDGQRSWTGVQLAEIPSARFKVDARSGFVVFMVANEVIDVLPPDSPVSVAHISLSARPWRLVRQRGSYDFASVLRDFDGVREHFWADEQLIVTRLIDSPPAAAMAAMDRATFLSEVWRSTREISLFSLPLLLALLATTSLVLRHQLSLRSQLKRAIHGRQFYIRYQPVIELASGRCVGAEALIHWKHPDGRATNPAHFIPAAERSGLIGRITKQVLELVAQDIQVLVRQHPEAHIAINLSAEDVNTPHTEQRLKRLVSDAGIEPRHIVVEVTESGLVRPEHAQDLLVTIRAGGFRVAIDDFGTGQSSLSYLATYELDYLKIDKKFVDALDSDGPGTKLAYHIIDIAKTLGLQMIAEGVETEGQHRRLQAAGVEYAQGWLFGKPMGMEELIAFMDGRRLSLPPLTSS
ncbi:MAG: putative cyclic di-GMP phosphodiesterase PdeB [Pseudomonas citronellolis]|nr:MAG: putative cyclic di-GMP phosphodiesterase PdeB [Pseudomonas citronellolis]